MLRLERENAAGADNQQEMVISFFDIYIAGDTSIITSIK